MKIMKVVYSQEKCELRNLDWSASYMGEGSWSVGENFNGEFVKGVVEAISEDVELVGEISIWVKAGDSLVCAMTIPPHAVQRIYYGE